MVFSLDQKEDKELKDWNFTIFDESGKIIRKYNADLRHKRNFSIFNLFKSNDKVTSLKVRLPKQIEWNGYDSDGKIPPDGRYICRLNIHFKDNTDWQSEGKYFYLDYHPPLIKVISEVKTFRANNEKNREYLTIFQETKAENSDRWKGTIYNSENIPIRTFLWETPKVPKVFTWDGKDDRGIPMDQGKYSYEISGEDFSENMSSILINDIELKKKDPSVSVQALSDSFSPNGDNWEDSITFRLNIPETKKLKSWKMSIYEKEIKPGKEIKVFSGEESFPYYVDWDGMNEQSKKQASDSEYLYILEVDYSSEKIQTEPKKFTLDSSPIKIKFKLSSKKFTPDLDGDDDILIIN
ncbi:MAG: hypothetical protein KDK36_08810, partial [Leptospiraceae bacterium]|nr:hypothetical protein [Leptospiraceae bacterium]